MNSLRTIIDKKFKKRSTLILVFLLTLSTSFFNSSLATGADTRAHDLHKRLVNISSLEEARRLSFETTSKMTYPELLSFWEEGSKNNWADISGAARCELAKRWSKLLEIRPMLDRVVDTRADPSFRLELIDTIGHFKRMYTGKQKTESRNALEDIIGKTSDPISVRVSACHRLAGLIRLMLETQDLPDDTYLKTTSLLTGLLLDGEQPAELRSKAASSLGVIKDKNSEINLLNILKQWHEIDPVIVRGAILALGRLKSEEAIHNISEILSETSELALYATASFALGMIGGTEVIEPLVKNRSRFPTPNCLSSLRRNKSAIQSVLDGQAQSCPYEVALEALCLVATENDWKIILESLPSRDLSSKKTILEMAVEVSPNLTSITPILTQIRSESQDAEMNRNIEFLLRRSSNLTEKSDE